MNTNTIVWWRLLLVFLLLSSTFPSFAQEGIIARMKDYHQHMPQEKLYVHTDKPYYSAGDTVWYRIHMVDAATHIPVCRSHYVYVELWDNMADTLVLRDKIKCDSNGVFANAIVLPEKTKRGSYTMAAYTRWMQNFGQDSFFKRSLRVVSSDSSRNEAIPRKAISVAVMPEGGYLIAGQRCRLAYKIIGDDGIGADAEVRLVRKGSEEVVMQSSTTHRGMGYLSYISEANDSLRLEVYTPDGLSSYADIPAPLTTGASLLVEQHNDMLMVKPVISNDFDLSRLALVCYGTGNLFYKNLESATALKIPCKALRPGTISIALVDTLSYKIWAERLVFIKEHQQSTASIRGIAASKRKPMDISITNLPSGCYSLSVNDFSAVKPDSVQPNIETYLLLTSELRGTIEKPSEYFDTRTAAADKKLDILMMTQGWRRYDLGDMLNGIYPATTHEMETAQCISGSVRGIIKKHLKHPMVQLVIPSEGMRREVEVDDEGRFKVCDMDFPDGVTMLLEGTRANGRSDFVKLSVDSVPYPQISLLTKMQGNSYSMANVPNAFHRQEQIMSMTKVGSLHYQLQEVLKTGKKRAKPLNKYGMAAPRAILPGDPRAERIYSHEYLLGQLGIVYIDNMPIDKEDMDEFWLYLQPSQIKAAEYFPKGTDGLHHGNAVLYVYTKDIRDYKSSPRHVVITPKGYKQSVSFYSPQYGASNTDDVKPDQRTTLYWTPSVQADADGVAHIRFHASDISEQYLVTLEGVSSKGAVIHRETVIR